MAKIKNLGRQPRGFFTDDGTQVVVHQGQEAEFNMSEADFNKVKELAESEDPPQYEVSGSHGGVKRLSAKEQKEHREAEEKKHEAEAKKAAADEEKARAKAER